MVDRLNRALEVFERGALIGAVLLMAATGIANVIGRNLFGQSLASAEELSQMLMVLVTFVGVGYGVRHARHVRMSALHEQLPRRARKALWIVCCAGTALVLVVLAYHAARYAAAVRESGRVSPVLRAPLWIVYACVPVGLGLGAVQYCLAIVRNLTHEDVHLSFQRRDDEPDGAPADGPPGSPPPRDAA
jgi:C4-dicarboxylate transporter, DctQ subunit